MQPYVLGGMLNVMPFRQAGGEITFYCFHSVKKRISTVVVGMGAKNPQGSLTVNLSNNNYLSLCGIRAVGVHKVRIKINIITFLMMFS